MRRAVNAARECRANFNRPRGSNNQTFQRSYPGRQDDSGKTHNSVCKYGTQRGLRRAWPASVGSNQSVEQPMTGFVLRTHKPDLIPDKVPKRHRAVSSEVFDVRRNRAEQRERSRNRGSGCRVPAWIRCAQNMCCFVAPAFENDFETGTFDQVGAGGSDLAAYDKTIYSSLSGYADDLIEIGRELELEDAIFVGHSVSSMIGVWPRRRPRACSASSFSSVPRPDTSTTMDTSAASAPHRWRNCCSSSSPITWAGRPRWRPRCDTRKPLQPELEQVVDELRMGSPGSEILADFALDRPVDCDARVSVRYSPTF